jgi:hypothetical protein
MTEVLLVVGLAIMLYGSFTNLNLGANGYEVGSGAATRASRCGRAPPPS